MKYFIVFLLLSFFGCASQNVNLEKMPIPYEDANHFPYELTPEKFLIIKSQQQMDAVFSIIHRESFGNRFAPIPTIIDNETYIIIKPSLKNSNDVEVQEIYLHKNKIYIKLKEFENPQIQKQSRKSPNVLIKLLQNINEKELILNF